MHRVAVILGVILCLVAIGAYSLWPVEDDYELATDPTDGQAN